MPLRAPKDGAGPDPARRPVQGSGGAGRPPLSSAVQLLQRGAGNRASARLLRKEPGPVTVELRTPPPLVKPAPATERATPENRDLAQEIDRIDKLSDADLVKQRTEVTLKLERYGVLQSEHDEHTRLSRTLNAIEYVASWRRKEARHAGDSARERLMAPVTPDWMKYDYIRRDRQKRRAWVRWLVEQRVREEHSLKDALKVIRSTSNYGNDVDEIADDLDDIEKEGERFGREFENQARQNAKRVLDGSQRVIEKALTDYGLDASAARSVAEDWFKSEEGVPAHHTTAKSGARDLVEASKKNNATAYIKGGAQRERLGTAATNLQGLQKEVADAKKTMWQHAGEHKGDPVADKAAFVDAKSRLATAWFAAERDDPIFAGLRAGRDREKRDMEDSPFGTIDLSGLAAPKQDDQMAAVAERVIPTLAHIGRARTLIYGGMSPLRLPAIVALTSANMFIPEGSIRSGVVNDIVDAERKHREGWMVMAASIALSLVTLLPTGGASLAMVNLAAAALAAYSSLEELEKYELQKVLVDTDLDKARSLSQEEPSLAGFAMSLVGLGLEGWAQLHAFSRARELKGLLQRGKDGSLIVAELNDFGRRRGLKNLNLGDRARDEIEAAERAAKSGAKAPKPVEPPPKAPKPAEPAPPKKKPTSAKETAKDEYEKVADKPKQKKKKGKGSEAEPEHGAKGPPRPPPRPTTTQTTGELAPIVDTLHGQGLVGTFDPAMQYTSSAALRADVRRLIAGMTSGTAEEPLMTALRQALPRVPRGNPTNRELLGVLEDVYRITRDPQLVEDAIVRLWQEAGRRKQTVRQTLEQLVGGPIQDITGELTAAHLRQPGALRDLSFAADFHGAHSHMFQEYLIDFHLGRGTTARLRRNIANSTGPFINDPTRRGIQRPFWSHVWDALFDVPDGNHINRPEIIGKVLQQNLGLPRWRP
jgi:hypothetical protein